MGDAFNDKLRRPPAEREAEEIDGIVVDVMDLPTADRARVFALIESLLVEQREAARRRVN